MTKMILPVDGLLINRDHNDDECSYQGDLRCPCGCETFRIRHNGKQAKPFLGLFVTNWIKPAEEPLVIDAHCTACEKAIPLYCSQRDGQGWLLPAGPAMTEFTHPKLRDQNVRVNVWYCWDEAAEMENGQYTATSTLFSLAAWNEEHPKEIPIFEEA